MHARHGFLAHRGKMQPSQKAQLLVGVALSLILRPAQGSPAAGPARPLIIADGCVIAKMHFPAPYSQRRKCTPVREAKVYISAVCCL